MESELRKKWVAARAFLNVAAGLGDRPRDVLRDWARQTLSELTSAGLDPQSIREISDDFADPLMKLSLPRWGELSAYLPRAAQVGIVSGSPDLATFIRQEQQALQFYPGIAALPGFDTRFSASSLDDPYSSPSSYLSHPIIDVLDQETITKIASRSTGA